MKPIKILFIASIILALGAIIYSCQKEETQTPVAPKGNPMLKADYTAETDCNAVCLQDGPFYQETESFTAQWGELSAFPGYFRNNKYFISKAWNDLDSFYISVNMHGYRYGQTGGKIKTKTGPDDESYPFTSMIVTLNGETYTFPTDNPATPGVQETALTMQKGFALPAGWDRCFPMSYGVRLEGDGHPVWLGTAQNQQNVTYNLIDECSCETSFTGVTQCGDMLATVCGNTSISCNHLASFTFIASAPGYVVITGTIYDPVEIQQICGDLELISSTADPGNNALSITFAGDVFPCEEVKASALWNSNNFETNITGIWTATLYEDESQQTLLYTGTVAPMGCY